MGVKEIDKATFYSVKPSNKKALFIADIQYIYENRIEYSELTDFVYSKKTGLNDVIRYAHQYFAGMYFRLTGKHIKNYSDIPFIMTKVTDENNVIHVYCAFNPDTWDRMIESAKSENG